MSESQEIRQKYLKDADETGHKSKFGFFSIPPSATAGFNAFQKKDVVKDQNGKVVTEERNIYSGLTASGTLKKSYFKYETSVFQGDPFMDPGKHDQHEKYEEYKKLEGKEIYKPLSLSKTPIVKAAYDYVLDNPQKRKVKDVTDSDGKVITEERNVFTNPQTKIEKQRLRQIKYIPDPYQNFLTVRKEEQLKSIQLRGEGPFKSSSPVKEYFSTTRELYGGNNPKQRKGIKLFNASAQHDSKFRPSCTKRFDIFSYPEYKPSGENPSLPKVNTSCQKSEQFKPVKQPNKFKPSPSISTMRSNLLRTLR